MDEEFGADFITLTDEEGNEFELEYLDTLEYKNEMYMAFFPTLEEGQDEDSEDYGLIILRCVPGQNGEEDTLESVDDENILNAVYDQFMETLFDDEEDEDPIPDLPEPPAGETLAELRSQLSSATKARRAVGILTLLMWLAQLAAHFSLMPALYWDEPLLRTLGRLGAGRGMGRVIMLSASGRPLTQALAAELSHEPVLTLLCSLGERRVGKECRSRWSTYPSIK